MVNERTLKPPRISVTKDEKKRFNKLPSSHTVKLLLKFHFQPVF